MLSFFFFDFMQLCCPLKNIATSTKVTVGCTVQKSTDTQHQCHDQDDWLSQLYFLLSTCLVRTLERAQESGKAAPSAQRTMDPEIPLS